VFTSSSESSSPRRAFWDDFKLQTTANTILIIFSNYLPSARIWIISKQFYSEIIITIFEACVTLPDLRHRKFWFSFLQLWQYFLLSVICGCFDATNTIQHSFVDRLPIYMLAWWLHPSLCWFLVTMSTVFEHQVRFQIERLLYVTAFIAHWHSLTAWHNVTLLIAAMNTMVKYCRSRGYTVSQK
jgi:hypothetical protein